MQPRSGALKRDVLGGDKPLAAKKFIQTAERKQERAARRRAVIGHAATAVP